MNMKKIYSLVLALALGVQPLASQAVNLENAFSTLAPGAAIATNDAGRFNSAARSGFSAGGVEMRIPRPENTPQLLSVTPPRISAGCNGISAHFGGFSFISGAEFGNLLKQIASGAALGFVSSLVMKTLCPACEAVVQELKSAAQAASRLARDSCEIGRNFGEQFAMGNATSGDQFNSCSKIATATGETSDSLAAFNSVCQSLTSVTQTFDNFARRPNADGSAKTPQQLAASEFSLGCSIGMGNQTWRNIAAFDSSGVLNTIADDSNQRKLILLNLMGAEMVYSGESKGVGCDTGNGQAWNAGDSENESQQYCKPPVDLKAMTGYFMCGAPEVGGNPPGAQSTRVRDYCRSFHIPSAGTGQTQLWTCKASKGGADDFINCPYLELAPASQVIRGEGFLVQVNNLLREGVARVRNGQGFDDDEGRKLIGLINSAPYPLYQAINAAAVYPTAADDLIDSMSVLVAEQFAYAVFDEMLRLEGRSSGNECVTRAQATQLLDFVSSMRSQNSARLALIAQNFNVQQGITEQIRQINVAIQRQVLSQDLIATTRMTEAINKAVTANGGSGSTTPPVSGD